MVIAPTPWAPIDLPAWTEYEMYTKRFFGTVLDAGCGNGDYTLCLRTIPAVDHVTSLDILPIDQPHHGKSFRENVPDPDWHQGDVQSLPFLDGSFDCVLCWDMLQNVPDGRMALREFRRVARLGGLVSVRTVIKSRIPWVIPGQTIEVGSSGVGFIAYTIWDPEDLERAGLEVGMKPIQMHIDPWNHMNVLFEVGK